MQTRTGPERRTAPSRWDKMQGRTQEDEHKTQEMGSDPKRQRSMGWGKEPRGGPQSNGAGDRTQGKTLQEDRDGIKAWPKKKDGGQRMWTGGTTGHRKEPRGQRGAGTTTSLVGDRERSPGEGDVTEEMGTRCRKGSQGNGVRDKASPDRRMEPRRWGQGLFGLQGPPPGYGNKVMDKGLGTEPQSNGNGKKWR